MTPRITITNPVTRGIVIIVNQPPFLCIENDHNDQCEPAKVVLGLRYRAQSAYSELARKARDEKHKQV
jgi:hypothetical protein